VLLPPPPGTTTPASESQAVLPPLQWQSIPATPRAQVLGRPLGSDANGPLRAPWDHSAPKDNDDAAAGKPCAGESQKREPQLHKGSTPGSPSTPSFCCEAFEQRPLDTASPVFEDAGSPPMSMLLKASLLKSGLAKESQQAPTTLRRMPAVVRLARCQDLLVPACSRSQSASHLRLEYYELCRQLHLQRALGATRADLATIMRWYVPYAVLGLLLGLALVTMFHRSLWLLPLTAPAIIMLTVLHFARL